MSIVVPPQDLAPSVASRIVTLKFADLHEGPVSEPGTVTFVLPGDLRVPADDVIIRAGAIEVQLDANGEGQVRLPTHDPDAIGDGVGSDWYLLVKKSWNKQVDMIRVPAGTDPISLADINPVLEVTPAMGQWLLTGAGVELVEGSAWGATVAVAGGIARFRFTVPSAAIIAGAAVDAELAARDIVEGADPRLLTRAESDNLSFAVVDMDGRRTWLEADLTGGPTQYALSRIGLADVVPALPTEDWAHWGDSLTDERVTGTGGWVTKLSAMTGKAHYNGGWYGQFTGQIAARQGGLPALVTVSSNTIPASGSVAVTAIRNSPVEVHASLGVYGTLAGVHGFMREATTDVTTFTRTTAGAAVPCPPGTRFIPDDATTLRDRQVTIWVGRNDVYTTDPQLVVAAVRAMIDYLAPSVKRAMVMEIVPSETSPASHSLLLAMNNALKAAFPAEWEPVATWLRTAEAATAAGITFTAEDTTDITAGITPRSFRSDAVHLNATGCTAVAEYVRAAAQKRGWLA